MSGGGIAVKKQFSLILKRLKKPSVVISIVSQILAILALLHVSVDVDAVHGITISVCTILALLGIMSNPETKAKGYGDDIQYCNACGKDTNFCEVNGKMVCSECGAAAQENAPDDSLDTDPNRQQK